ncbi:hypothetical protein [Caenimonas aquaedulcis]|uniref:Uncharacterized protein n=1 Tax=Caenimonas aquaedulcis TaxID=2793270 RepID=A0A931MHV8_9BURK|nr:hypothetical protein [Caenimonas aquaedulcis]MBG9389342.1 hypothetical protein [Caenimonas aquaedulcis]
MKRLLLSAALAAPLACFAGGGVIDGAYQCVVGPKTGAIAVVGYPDGRAAFGVVALEDYQDLNGYGLGQVVGSTFSGTTNSGGSFNMTISGTNLVGTAQLRVGGQMTTVSASCSKIY